MNFRLNVVAYVSKPVFSYVKCLIIDAKTVNMNLKCKEIKQTSVMNANISKASQDNDWPQDMVRLLRLDQSARQQMLLRKCCNYLQFLLNHSRIRIRFFVQK